MELGDQEEAQMMSENGTPSKPYNQCSRLYSCIQAAVAQMVNTEKGKEWATRRVKLLMALIPQNPQFPLGEHTVYTAVVSVIDDILMAGGDAFLRCLYFLWSASEANSQCS